MKTILLFLLRKIDRPALDTRIAYAALSLQALESAATAEEKAPIYHSLAALAAALHLFEEAALARRNAEALRAVDSLQLAFDRLLQSETESPTTSRARRQITPEH